MFLVFIAALVGCTSTAPAEIGDDVAGEKGAAAPRVLVRRCADAPAPDSMLAGSTAVYAGCYEFRGVGGEAVFTMLEFSLLNFGDDEVINAVTVEYTNSGGFLETATAYPVEGVISFSATDLYFWSSPAYTGWVGLYVDVDDGTDADLGMTARLDWVDEGVGLFGDLSGKEYGPEIVFPNHVAGVTFTYVE